MVHRFALPVTGLLLLCGWGLALPQEESAVRELRRGRAYFGAPPTTPHALGLARTNCLACHGESARIAPVTPHPDRVQCQQCHVDGSADPEPFRGNTFKGLAPPPRTAATDNAGPPPMAHSELLHENCLTCHGPGERDAIVSTPHPERPGCTSCHRPQEVAQPSPRSGR